MKNLFKKITTSSYPVWIVWVLGVFLVSHLVIFPAVTVAALREAWNEIVANVTHYREFTANIIAGLSRNEYLTQRAAARAIPQ
jgi:hypothetical protein